MGLTGDTLQVCMEPTNKKGRFAVADKKKFYNYRAYNEKGKVDVMQKQYFIYYESTSWTVVLL